MLNTYLNIAQHLFDKLPEVNWIDRDKGQIDNEEKYNTLITPAILLDFNEIIWTGTTRGSQIGSGAIIVKLIFPKPGETFTRNISPLQDYTDMVTLGDDLHTVIGGLRQVKERRKSVDYFTTNWYVIEQFYDLEVTHEVPIATRPKPAPNILSATINIQQQ